MKSEFRNKVENWLKDLGCTPVEINDEDSHWHLRIDYPAKSEHQMHVVSPKDKPNAVVVASGANFAHEHLQAFEQLDDEAKEGFLFEFRKSINSVSVDFQLEGVKGELDCPKLFQVSVTRYQDGLTMDSFAHSVGAVFKTELNARWTVQHFLGAQPFGGTGRFDFKRIGLT